MLFFNRVSMSNPTCHSCVNSKQLVLSHKWWSICKTPVQSTSWNLTQSTKIDSTQQEHVFKIWPSKSIVDNRLDLNLTILIPTDVRNNPMPTRGDYPGVGPKIYPQLFGTIDSYRIMAQLLSTNWKILNE